jgi:hypothetical protein
MPPSSLEQMAREASWQRRSIVLVLVGFFDESGEHGTRGALKRLTMGGFWAPWESVERLCVAWRAALAVESLSEFHMKEIASDEHLYDCWPAERQRRLDRFVDILCEHAAQFGAFSYPVTGAKNAFREAYEPGLARVLITTSSLCDKAGERGRVVFAQTHEIKQELVGRYFDRLGWAQYLDGYAVLVARHNPALQAAEIVARGLRRLMEDGAVIPSFLKICRSGKPLDCWPHDPVAASLAIQAVRRAEAAAARPLE